MTRVVFVALCLLGAAVLLLAGPVPPEYASCHLKGWRLDCKEPGQ